MKLWKIEEQTKGKHLVLKAYLNEWLPKLSSWNQRVVFIDGFSGPGEYSSGEDGSPIIALRTMKDHDFSAKCGEIVFRFCDADKKTLDYLKTRVDSLGELPNNFNIDYWHADFVTCMNELLSKLEAKNKNLAPSLVMLDPFGITGIPLTLIRRILKNQRCEVLVSIMWEHINRFCTTSEFERLNEVIGGEDWKPARELAEMERQKFLFDLYERRLKEAGAKHVVRYDLYNGNRHKYSIFHASQHWKGADAMKRAIWKHAPDGSFDVRAHQLSLSGFQPTELEAMLVKKFGGEWTTYKAMEEFVGSDQTPFHTSQLNTLTLAVARKEKRVEVRPDTRGLKDKELRFPV